MDVQMRSSYILGSLPRASAGSESSPWNEIPNANARVTHTAPESFRIGIGHVTSHGGTCEAKRYIKSSKVANIYLAAFAAL